MRVIHEIEYEGKNYPVKEPTLDVWMRLTAYDDFRTDFQVGITLIEWITELPRETILSAEAGSIIAAAEGIIKYYLENSDEYYDTFEHMGKRYKFIDLASLSFGEFVDIDDLLNKPESARKQELHKLMSLLYRELDEKGNYLPYDVERIIKTSEEFKTLPIRYFRGAMVFFSRIENTLRENTPYSFLSLHWMIQKRADWKRWIKTHGGGIRRLSSSVVRTYSMLNKWFKSIIWRSSTS
jgi:hypothetical protein